MKTRRLQSTLTAGLAISLIFSTAFLSGCGQPDDEAPVAEPGTGHLVVNVLYAEDGPQADDARLLVETAAGDHVTGPTGRSDFELDTGDYRITATLDRASASADASIRADERTELQIVVNAGVLHLSALLVEDGPAAPDTRFTILAAQPDIRGERETITGPTGRNQFTLPAGSYLARARDGEASAEIEVEVTAGERAEATITLDAGYLQTSVVDADGNPITDNVRWLILSAEEDLQGRRQTLTGPTGRNQFLLPAGAHVVEVRAGNKTAQQEIAVTAGERTDITIELPEHNDTD